MAWHEPRQQAQPPILELTELNDDTYLLVDTRRLPDTTKISFLNRSQASFVLTGGGLHLTASEIDYAIAHNWVINVDESVATAGDPRTWIACNFRGRSSPKANARELTEVADSR